MVICIKERSLLARIAAWWLGVKVVAVTWGETIHLHGADTKTLLRDKAWLRHELKHVEQFSRHGRLTFLALYVWESIRKGYHQNRFEVEARASEALPHRAGNPIHLPEGPGFRLVSMHQQPSLPVDTGDQGGDELTPVVEIRRSASGI
jgi:hypothetical protein